MKIKAVLIDDELSAIKMLNALLDRYCPDVDVVKCFQDPFLALDFLENHPMDMVFLDVEMPGMTGFELLERIKKPQFDTIFTTAYDQYALEAFKADAVDYLLKPVDEEELIKAVKKTLDKKQIGQLEIDKIVSKINEHAEVNNFKIGLPFFDGVEFVPIGQIIYCEAENNYTQVVLTDGTKRVVSKTLKDIEKMIPHDFFFRVHNSYLINLNYVHKYMRNDGGYLIMSNGSRVKISRTKKEVLLTKL